MPSISATLDGNSLAAVCCDGFDVMTVTVSGIRTETDFANLGFAGGRYPEDAESTNLTWVNELLLQPGQKVGISLLQESVTSHRGKTIDELFPDGVSTTVPNAFKPTREIYEELRRKPKLRDGYAFQYKSTTGASYEGRTSMHGFGFTVLWNSYRPERVSISLHSYTIDSIEQRTPGHYHVREHLQIGQSATFEIDA